MNGRGCNLGVPRVWDHMGLDAPWDHMGPDPPPPHYHHPASLPFPSQQSHP